MTNLGHILAKIAKFSKKLPKARSDDRLPGVNFGRKARISALKYAKRSFK